MALEPHIRPELSYVLDSVSSRQDLFRMFSHAVADLLPAVDGASLFDALVKREGKLPTSTPEGVAFPHALTPEIERTLIVVAHVHGGVDFGVQGHPRSDLVFCMFGCSRDPWEHVRLLARLARICRSEASRNRLRAARDGREFYDRLIEEDRGHA